MDARGAGRHGHVRPVIDHDRNSAAPAPEPRTASSQLARSRPLEPQLYRGHPPTLGRQRQRDEISASHQAVIGDEHEANELRLHYLPCPPSVRLHGIRGATTVARNDSAEILAATDELLRTLIEANELQAGRHRQRTLHCDQRSGRRLSRPRRRGIWLEHRSPAARARRFRFRDRCPMCIRLLVHAYTARSRAEIKHCYLRGATVLRPDRA